MEKILSFLTNDSNFKFIVKKIKIEDVNLLNKLYEIGIRKNECILIKYNKKNNKNIVFVTSRSSEYAFRKDELDEIYGEICR